MNDKSQDEAARIVVEVKLKTARRRQLALVAAQLVGAAERLELGCGSEREFDLVVVALMGTAFDYAKAQGGATA